MALTGTMGMTLRKLISARIADFNDLNVEVQCHARQWMVRIHINRILFNGCHPDRENLAVASLYRK